MDAYWRRTFLSRKLCCCNNCTLTTRKSYRKCDRQLKTILDVAFTLHPNLYSERDIDSMREKIADFSVEAGTTFIYNLRKHSVTPAYFKR